MFHFRDFLSFVSLLALNPSNILPKGQTVFRPEQDGYFNWTSISPSNQLHWHKCYERQECARLEVPMDPKDPSLHETVVLAVIRDPVNVSRSDPSYGGSILTNPGGPGGSGVGFLRWMGYEAHHKIEGPKHFDLVSWDPRGVGHTTPELFCFDSELERQLYWINQDTAGMVDESEYALHYNLQAAKAFGQACNSTIMRYMTTLSTVLDLVAIADALEPDVKDPLINFWGVSYGTFIGNTLASTHPHRLGKTILDAVVSSYGYVHDTWSASLTDTDHILSKFYSTCHKVGREKCPLYESKPHLIRKKVDKLISSLQKSPIVVSDPIAPYRSAKLLTSSTLRFTIFTHLYKPHMDFSFLSSLLHGLTESPPNTTLAASFIPSLSDPHKPLSPSIIRPTNSSWDNDFPTSPSKSTSDSERIIACTDASPISNWTLTNFTSLLTHLSHLSPIAAGSLITTVTTCTGWPIDKRPPPHVRFPGPFGSNLSSYSLSRGARPILFIGNEADPITPLAAAQAESAKHEGSVVLKTNIFGHATGPVNPSKCAWEVERRYWNFGELPREDLVCEGDWDIEKWEMKQDKKKQ